MSKDSIQLTLARLLAGSAASIIATTAAASVLGDTASSMAAGEWKKLPVTFQPNVWDVFHHSIRQTHDILEFGNTGTWDPTTRKVYFIGSGHPWGEPNSKFLQYEEATNTITSTENLPTFTRQVGHAYDHNALDVTRGVFYAAQYYTRNVSKFHISSNTWSQLPPLPRAGSTKGLAFFPEMDALIVVDPVNRSIYSIRDGANAWTTIRSDIYQSNYHFIAEYDHVRKVVYFGGGNQTPTAFYELDRNGSVQQLAPPPLNIDLGGSGGDNVTDPVSGRLIIRLGSTGQIAEYVPEVNRWNLLTAPVPPELSKGDTSIAAPISTYGVIMYIAYHGGNGASVWLYKHKQGPLPPADNLPPRAPNSVGFK